MQSVEPVKEKETDADCTASKGEGLFSESLSICRQHAESKTQQTSVAGEKVCIYCAVINSDSYLGSPSEREQ